MSNDLKLKLQIEAEIRDAEEKLADLRTRLEETAAAGTDAGGKSTKSFEDLTKEIKKTEKEVDKLKKKLKDAGDAGEQAGDKTSTGLSKIKKVISGVIAGTVTLAAAVAAVTFKQTIKETNELAEAADTLDMPIEEISQYSYAAKKLKIDVKNLTDSMVVMNSNLSQAAANGKGGAAEALEELGLSAVQLSQSGTAEQITQIADAIADLQNSGDQLRLTKKIFGGNEEHILKLLKKGSAGISELREEAIKLDGAIDAKTAENVKRVSNEMDRLASYTDKVKKRIGELTASGMSTLLEFFDIGESSPAEEVDAQITAIEARLNDLQNMDSGTVSTSIYDLLLGEGGARGVAHETEKAIAELKRLKEEKNKIANDKAIEQAHREEQRQERQHNREMFQARNEAINTLKQQLKQQQAAYGQHLVSLRQYQAQEEAIAKEFGQLTSELGAGNDTPDFIDVNETKRKANDALNSGDYNKAIELARKAGDMMKQMKADGDKTTVAFQGVAKELERIAKAAAKGNTSSEKKVGKIVEQKKKELQELITGLEDSAKVNVQFNVDGSQLAAEVQQVVNSIQATVSVPIVTGVGAGYEIQREAQKRGDTQ